MQETFAKQAREKDTPASKGRGLNYIWLNKERFTPSGTVKCGVPLHCFDQSILNAAKYPDTEVDIWIDFDLIDEGTLQISQEHIQKSGFKNLNLKNLQDIPAYAGHKSTLFNPEVKVANVVSFVEGEFEYDPIWGRVDLARLLVLQHCLKRSDIEDAIYSDFDSPDVLLDHSKAQNCLGEFGMIFGAVIDGEGETEIENTYFAFRKSKMDNKFFEDLIRKTQKEAEDGVNGYQVFYYGVKDWFEGRDIKNYKDMATLQVSPPMRYKIPKPPEYDGFCV